MKTIITEHFIETIDNKVLNKYTPINEKLDILLHWLNNHSQFYVDRIKSINDCLKLYEYCFDNDIEFFDNLNDSCYYTMEETNKFQIEIKNLLGYSIF